MLNRKLTLLEKAREREWEYTLTSVKVLDPEDTEILVDYADALAQWANKLCSYGIRPKIMWYEGSELKECEITPKLSTRLSINQQRRYESVGSSLFDANQLRLLEFIQDQLESNKNVLIASMQDDTILSAWGNFPSRRLGGLNAHELLDSNRFSNRDAWAETMPMKERLYDLLESEGQINQYYHELVMPNNQRNGYSHDFYYLENYHGVPVRVVVSQPEDYLVIREGGLFV